MTAIPSANRMLEVAAAIRARRGEVQGVIVAHLAAMESNLGTVHHMVHAHRDEAKLCTACGVLAHSMKELIDALALINIVDPMDLEALHRALGSDIADSINKEH